MSEERKPFWAKCRVEACGHCWPIAYLPMDMVTAARLMKSPCPMCGDRKPEIAKQNDGVLQEDGAPPAGKQTIAVTIGAAK
jgi:hypothetical protein